MRFVLSAVLVAVLAVVAAQTFRITGSAAIYPFTVSIAALLCSVIMLLSQLRQATARGQVSWGGQRSAIGTARLAGFAAVWIGYVLLLSQWGFILATWLALFLSLVLLRGRPTFTSAFGTMAFVLLFAVLIKVVLYVPVPQGWLDERLDMLLYGIF
ncbi:tripartite tricarboxylate transporter TctB family protein [Telmatospirillum sp. J64-1]|uniref:tripartite tricarboxylate transporter TctB family protein n=1 Tax=Telmatospirillum sp. J64-1 TaxID=2502183 RepID=UPI00115F2777|nr:tripartite tricarboxylate transporter TctB family protein [Telmatospirillum sp. J64-1]